MTIGQYIDKAALVAEIERLRKVYKQIPTRSNYEDGLKEGRLIGYKDALDKINKFDVIDEDFKKLGLPSEMNVFD